ncbi:MAG: hypothetical protein M3Y17_10325 [Actinomycetota bacterium]|nr:hypothetical protein [Actinomycetota bacterium]
MCDADGTILWIDGEPWVLDEAREINLTPGAGWSEAHAGTNAMVTGPSALHARSAVSITGPTGPPPQPTGAKLVSAAEQFLAHATSGRTHKRCARRE